MEEIREVVEDDVPVKKRGQKGQKKEVDVPKRLNFVNDIGQEEGGVVRVKV